MLLKLEGLFPGNDMWQRNKTFFAKLICIQIKEESAVEEVIYVEAHKILKYPIAEINFLSWNKKGL